MTIDEARERVERGAALLDEKKPGWREKVNPKTLDMGSDCGCVLGQLFGIYILGLGLLGIGWTDDGHSRHGFDLGYADVVDRASYALLQDAWLEQLGANGTVFLDDLVFHVYAKERARAYP